MCSSRIAGGLRVPLCPFKREVEPQRYSLQFSSDHQCREIESDGPEREPFHVSPVCEVQPPPVNDVEPVDVLPEPEALYPPPFMSEGREPVGLMAPP